MGNHQRRRSKWRTTIWLVFIACVAFLSYILTYGFFHSAEFLVQVEAFAGFFVLGCVLLLLHGRGGAKKKGNARP